MGTPSKGSAWLRVDRLLGEWAIPLDSPAGWRQLEQALAARRGNEEGEEFKAIRRGWYLGENAFRKELLAKWASDSGQNITEWSGRKQQRRGRNKSSLRK